MQSDSLQSDDGPFRLQEGVLAAFSYTYLAPLRHVLHHEPNVLECKL
jgi:hypothetical protein